MRCPKCGYISFDDQVACAKCKLQFDGKNALPFQGTAVRAESVLYLRSQPAVEEEPAFEPMAEETSDDPSTDLFRQLETEGIGAGMANQPNEEALDLSLAEAQEVDDLSRPEPALDLQAGEEVPTLELDALDDTESLELQERQDASSLDLQAEEEVHTLELDATDDTESLELQEHQDASTLDLQAEEEVHTLELDATDDTESLELQEHQDASTLDLQAEEEVHTLELDAADDTESLELQEHQDASTLDLQAEEEVHTLELDPGDDTESLELQEHQDASTFELLDEEEFRALESDSEESSELQGEETLDEDFSEFRPDIDDGEPGSESEMAQPAGADNGGALVARETAESSAPPGGRDEMELFDLEADEEPGLEEPNSLDAKKGPEGIFDLSDLMGGESSAPSDGPTIADNADMLLDLTFDGETDGADSGPGIDSRLTEEDELDLGLDLDDDDEREP